MKIRLSYVSNSSSSSFLIIYKNIEDFARFSMFNGYEILINDLKNIKDYDEKVKTFLINKIKIYFYHFCHNFTSGENNFDEWDQIDKIFNMGGIEIFEDYGPFDKFFKTFNKYKQIFWDDLKKKNENFYNFVYPLYGCSIDINEVVLRELENDERQIWFNALNEYRKKCDEFYYGADFQNQIEKVVNELVDKFSAENKIKMKCIDYEDDTHNGSMMEHEFMPFIGMDPEEKIKVFQNYNH